MSSSKQLTPVKCGLKFKPPMLVLLYNDLDTGKTRKRSMPLRGFSSNTNVAAYLADLLQSPKHSKYLNTIPQEQLDSLLHRVKDAHCGVLTSSTSVVTSPSSIPPVSTAKPSSHYQSSLLDIPPIHTSSPNHTHLKKKEFDNKLEELINFDDDSKDGNKVSLGSDSLDKLLESPEHGGEKKETTVSRQLFSKENDEQGSTKLSDPPGLGGLGMGPKLVDTKASSDQEGDPLLSVLNGSAKRPFGVVPPLNSAKASGLGELPPIGGAPAHTRGARKAGSVQGNNSATQAKAENLQLSEREPDNIQNIPQQRSSDIFATEVPNYSEDFEDESLAVEELLEDDDSLGLGLGEKVYTGVRLSGSSSGDDLKRLNEIVTPPPMLDEGEKKSANDEDLNKATDEYLEKIKEEMNVLYELNHLKPGDEDYVYDKEVDFDVGPKMESGWDSDDTMSDF